MQLASLGRLLLRQLISLRESTLREDQLRARPDEQLNGKREETTRVRGETGKVGLRTARFCALRSSVYLSMSK